MSAAAAAAPTAFEQKVAEWVAADKASERFDAEVYEPLAERVHDMVDALPHVSATFLGVGGDRATLTSAKADDVKCAEAVFATSPRRPRYRHAGDTEFYRACRLVRVWSRRRAAIAQRLRRDEGLDTAIEQSNKLNDDASDARWAAIECPSRDLRELVAKLDFINDEPSDASAELIKNIDADVRRLAGVA